MSTQAVLTIIVPTYNRSSFLEKLLKALEAELSGLGGVCVIVGDNASTDATADVTARFQARQPAWRMLRHPENCGAEENFCRCIEQVQTPYFWIIGDDDLPREGVVRRVAELLHAEQPDLLYLRSEWKPDVGEDRRWPMAQPTPWRMRDRASFAASVHVWVTFISGMVVRRDAVQPPQALRRFMGSYLVQLGWVLPTLMAGHKFITVDEPWMLATNENTGGYKLLTVFGRNLVEVVESACSPDSVVSRHILRALLWNYLPGLLWMVRSRDTQAFQGESVLDALAPLRRFAAYRWLLVPLYRLPLPLAKVLMLVPRIYGKWLRVRHG